MKTRYVLDSTGEPLANEEGGVPALTGRGYYVTDPRGNLTQLLDHNALGAGPDAVAAFGYDPFGGTMAGLTAGKAKAGGSGTWDSRLRFQLDPLTGNRSLYAGCNPASLIDDGHKPKKPRGKKDFKPCGQVRIVKGGRSSRSQRWTGTMEQDGLSTTSTSQRSAGTSGRPCTRPWQFSGKREGMKKTTRLHAVDSRKRDAPRYESKPYYAHTTQRVRIGTELSFSGRIDYKSPWWSLDYSGVSVTGTCRA